MKKFITACLLVLLLAPAALFAGSAVFRYEDFGPQVAAHELLGFEWWQWEPHGDSDPASKPDIKVVVYWDEALDDIKTRFPVDQNKKQDYRYLEYDKAKKHLENLISDFKQSGLDAGPLRATLKKMKELKKPVGAESCRE